MKFLADLSLERSLILPSLAVPCFLGLSILDMPYTMLVSVVVGVTNVIPFFGPYIGAIPKCGFDPAF